MDEKNKEHNPIIQKVDYEIVKSYTENQAIRTNYYTQKLQKFMVSQELSMLPTKIINVILSAVKNEQKPLINQKEKAGFELEFESKKQLSFDDIFKDWTENSRAQFTISFQSIKLNKDIKNKDLFNSFIILSNLNWEIYDNEKQGVVELIPFIENVKWTGNKDRRERFIQFKMHRKTMESFLDMTRYLRLDSQFVMNLKSPKTLAFIFWVSKFFPYGGTTIGVLKFCEEMNIHYTYNSALETYLKRIRAEMNSSDRYEYGMNFRIENHLLKISTFEKKEGIGKIQNIDTLEDLQIKRALYHIVKKRALNPDQKVMVNKIYKETGYESISRLVKRKIAKDLVGAEYVSRLLEIISGK